MDWVSYWDAGTTVYVNAVHRHVHYADVANGIAALVPSPDACVLDFGCGEALAADRVKASCARLILCDAAPSVRRALTDRFAETQGIEVIAPADLERIPDGSMDLIVANSVVQYLDRGTIEDIIKMFKRLIRARGWVVFADILPSNGRTTDDARALLGYAARKGFLGAAVYGLARTALSDYPRVRAELGLSRFSESEFIALLDRHGLKAQRITPNLGHNQSRMAFAARPKDLDPLMRADHETPNAGLQDNSR